ncbi:Synapse-associated protein 1 [Bienertia sinuspersici]
MYSWFRRSFSRNSSNERKDTQNLETSKNHNKRFTKIEDEEFYGVTYQLIEFVKFFDFDTFKNFSIPDEENGGIQTTSSGVRVDLSEWQQQHATIILSKVKELSQLRYTLCPRHMKERQFWRIYFSLVKSYLAEYELQAIRIEKLRKMATAKEVTSDTNGIELEMTEANRTTSIAPP